LVLMLGQPWIGDEKAAGDGWRGQVSTRKIISEAIASGKASGLGYLNVIGVAADGHMLAFDDGTHTDYSISGGAGFPLLQAGCLLAALKLEWRGGDGGDARFWPKLRAMHSDLNRLLANRSAVAVGGALFLCQWVCNFSTAGGMMLLTTRGLSASRIGLLLMPSSVVQVTVAPLSGRLADKQSPAKMIQVGLLVGAALLLYAAGELRSGNISAIVLLWCAAQALFGTIDAPTITRLAQISDQELGSGRTGTSTTFTEAAVVGGQALGCWQAALIVHHVGLAPAVAIAALVLGAWGARLGF